MLQNRPGPTGGNCHRKAIIRIHGCRVIAITAFTRLNFSWMQPTGLAFHITLRKDRHSMTSPALLTPRQAAEKLGMSYPALKHWILAGRIRTVKTPGGHHRIPVEALSKFLPASQPHAAPSRISGRNQLLGNVAEIKIDGLLAKVVLSIGDQRVTAIITADAARDLALHPGDQAIALIKATEVMILRP